MLNRGLGIGCSNCQLLQGARIQPGTWVELSRACGSAAALCAARWLRNRRSSPRRSSPSPFPNQTPQLFYTEAFGNSTPELLPSLCNGAVTYCDAQGGGCDVFGCQGLADMIEEVCSTHPLLHIEVVRAF